MLRVSRIAKQVALSFTHDARSGSIATHPSSIIDESEGAALEPLEPDTSSSGARQRLTTTNHRYTSAAKNNGAASDPHVRLIQNQCLKMSLNLFNRPQRHTRSLGFTSAIPGEGKTLIASLTASALADRSHRSVTLVDCNWENPSLHAQLGVPNSPGLAEWLRRECDLADIRHSISPYLTVIPSGDASQDALALAERFRAIGATAILTLPEELLIADLPSALTTDYGALIAQALDAVLLVVRAGVTQEAYIAEASRELMEASVEGTVLNATRSSIPRWLLRLL